MVDIQIQAESGLIFNRVKSRRIDDSSLSMRKSSWLQTLCEKVGFGSPMLLTNGKPIPAGGNMTRSRRARLWILVLALGISTAYRYGYDDKGKPKHFMEVGFPSVLHRGAATFLNLSLSLSTPLDWESKCLVVNISFHKWLDILLNLRRPLPDFLRFAIHSDRQDLHPLPPKQPSLLSSSPPLLLSSSPPLLIAKSHI